MGEKATENDVDNVYDFQDASTLWAEKHNQLLAAEDAYALVEKRLGSVGLTVLDNLGMSARNLSDDQIRSTSPATIKKLSKRDLIRKREYLLRDITQLKQHIDDLSHKRNEFKQRASAQQQSIQDEFNAQQQMQQRSIYLANPSAFFKRMSVELPPKDAKATISPALLDQLYANAARLSAASSEFDLMLNPNEVMQAWATVSRARDEALLQVKALGLQGNNDRIAAEKAHAKNVAMFNYSQQMFINVINKLPSGMQGLLLLYTARDYDKVNAYLQRIARTDVNDTQTWEKIAHELAEDINAVTEKQARTMLANMANFKNLPRDVQDELIMQKAFTMRLAYDLSFIADGATKVQGLADLKEYTAQLDQNIQNAIANNRTLTQCTNDFNKIKQQLDRREAEIRSFYFKKQLRDRPEFALGVGLGAAWIFGIGVPAAAMVVVGVTIVKAHMESSPLRLRIADIEESRNLANMVAPVDYEFLQHIDALWGRGTNVPVDKARVNIKYVSDDVRDASMRGAKKAVDAIHRSMFGPILTVYAMQMFASTIFFIAAGMTLPIVWPLFAALGVAVAGGLTYVAGKNIVENVDLPNTRIYKVANAIVKAIDFAIIRPAKYIYNAIKNFLFQPEKHAFDVPEQAPDFSLTPELRSALDSLYPGLANRLEAHFKHRYDSLTLRTEHAKESHDLKAGIAIQRDRAQLSSDWHAIVAAVKNKQSFLDLTGKFLDRSYEQERREFVLAAMNAKNNNVVIAEEVTPGEFDKTASPVVVATRTTLIFNKDSNDPRKVDFVRDYVQERQNVQEIFDLKTIIARLGSGT